MKMSMSFFRHALFFEKKYLNMLENPPDKMVNKLYKIIGGFFWGIKYWSIIIHVI